MLTYVVYQTEESTMFGWFETLRLKTEELRSNMIDVEVTLNGRIDKTINNMTVLQHHAEELTEGVRSKLNGYEDLMELVIEKMAGRIENLESELDKGGITIQGLLKRIEALEGRRPDQLLVDEREIARSGDDPWANITFVEFDQVKGFKFEGDWNDAFITNLRQSGITGNSDEEVFQKYMARVALNISEKFESNKKVVDDVRGVQSEFE